MWSAGCLHSSKKWYHDIAFKSCVPFIKRIADIYGTTIDGTGDLDLIMPVYILLEYSSNYSNMIHNLQFYSKDEAIDFNDDIVNDLNLKSFTYKVKLLGDTEVDGTMES